jgi:hypothetical protein
MDIYLDTNLWNHLFKQSIDVEGFLPALDAKAIRLVLGDESIYELLRTFPLSGQRNPQTAMDLFSYLREFTSKPIPIAKTNMELVASEMWALKRNEETIDPIVTQGDQDLIHAVIEGVANGEVSDRERNHIAWRVSQASANRAGQIQHLKDEVVTKAYLRTISSERFPDWLDREAKGQVARGHLAWEIQQYFTESTREDANEYAAALQPRPQFRAARGIIRRTLYYNWRCAHRDSIPGDLYFDSNHILNSTYCDIYATEEAAQAEYAGHLLSTATSVQIYDRAAFPSIADWLLSLAP